VHVFRDTDSVYVLRYRECMCLEIQRVHVFRDKECMCLEIPRVYVFRDTERVYV